MLINDFYTLADFQEEENRILAHIILNASHEIFKGHFPGNPVTPGVCMMQIIKELVEKRTAKKLFMNQCSNVKFMALINPETNADLMIKIDLQSIGEEEIKIKSETVFDETVALKLVCNYKIVA